MGETNHKWLKGAKWLFVVVLVVLALVGSARTGVSLAKKNLPEWVQEKSEVLKNDKFLIGSEGQMIYLAEKNQDIKDFFNRYRTDKKREKADLDEINVRRLSAEIRIRVKKRDAGTVSVEVMSGPLNGEAFWMQFSQLLQREKIEDLPLIKDDK